MDEIPIKYDFATVERKWMRQWEAWGIHRWDPSRPREETFVVDSPPPTVSGSLHIGHVFSYTHQDLLVRHHRMRGRNIYYPMGWDDNGLPTERRVQNIFGIRCDPRLPVDPQWRPRRDKPDGAPPEDVSRRNFIEACALITREDEAAFEALWRHLGLSIDWHEQYATIDDHCRRISQLSFLDLVRKGEVYHIESPAMWDVDFKTAVAQAEVEDRELPGRMHDLAFELADGGSFVISTTRPELLAACIAVVAHPDDERYRPLFGRKAITPLFAAEVPILASEVADPEKGTGILMVCTFGDAMDVEWWKQSGLPLKQVIGSDGRLLEVRFGHPPFESRDPAGAQAAWRELAGLPVKAAQRKSAELLARDGTGPGTVGAALRGEPRPLTHPVKCYERGERPLEFIPTRQWFARILEHKKELLEQGRAIQWHPPHMRTRFEHWVEGLNQDWCISRQRYFGVPFPVWYPIRDDGSVDYHRPIHAREEDLPVDPLADTPPGYAADQRGRPGGFEGDPDVMDTWATSSLTPQIASHWQLNPQRHERLFPMDIRPQSHEIIRTWAFYTIVKAWMHDRSVPWHNVVISGWILDPERKKMSKSRGNVVTPDGLLDKHSVDGVRYWAGRARLGADTTFDQKVLKLGKRLATKIFNASRFVFMQLDRVDPEQALGPGEIRETLDQAFVDRLRAVVQQATDAFERFDYSVALKVSEEAFWEFCDHYLELVKHRSYLEKDTPGRRSAVASLRLGLSIFLRLFAPFLPYVTEEVWSWRLPSAGEKKRSIHTAPWPTLEELATIPRPETDDSFGAAVEVLTKIRGAKSEARKSLRWPLSGLSIAGRGSDLTALELVLGDVLRAGRVPPDVVTTADASPPEGNRFEVAVALAETEEG